MPSFHKHVSVNTPTPQSEPIFGRDDMVENNAGGYVFESDPWTRLVRFLILGTEGGTYYQTERKLTQGNAKHLISLIKEDGVRFVDTVVDVSDSGRAPKNSYAVFALAAASVYGNETTRRWVYQNLPQVCRIPTHLFQFVDVRESLGGGWGSGFKRAVQDWYGSLDDRTLVYYGLKYQQREGWSHRDLLRLSKPIPVSPSRSELYSWLVGKTDISPLDERVRAFGKLRNENPSPAEAVRIISDAKLTLEMVPNKYYEHAAVWEALLEAMPFHALLRNLGNMGKSGLLKPLSDASSVVVDRIQQADLRKMRVHPIQILIALRMYSLGRSVRGGEGTWAPVNTVVDALDSAFYRAFEFVEPTGKRFLLGVDVSGSMEWNTCGSVLSAREVAAAMSLVTAKTESNYHIMGFCHDFRDLRIGPSDSLKDVLKKTKDLPFGGTNCALPMIWADKNDVPVDVFVVITDNETWAGGIHPTQALKQYRDKTGINAKLAVMGVTASEFTIADPTDTGQLDMVGFDAAAPSVLRSFVMDWKD